jgi:hypothetical protein
VLVLKKKRKELVAEVKCITLCVRERGRTLFFGGHILSGWGSLRSQDEEILFPGSCMD